MGLHGNISDILFWKTNLTLMDNKRLKEKVNTEHSTDKPQTVLNILLQGIFQTEAAHNDAFSKSIIYAHINEMFMDQQKVHLSI